MILIDNRTTDSLSSTFGHNRNMQRLLPQAPFHNMLPGPGRQSEWREIREDGPQVCMGARHAFRLVLSGRDGRRPLGCSRPHWAPTQGGRVGGITGCHR